MGLMFGLCLGSSNGCSSVLTLRFGQWQRPCMCPLVQPAAVCAPWARRAVPPFTSAILLLDWVVKFELGTGDCSYTLE